MAALRISQVETTRRTGGLDTVTRVAQTRCRMMSSKPGQVAVRRQGQPTRRIDADPDSSMFHILYADSASAGRLAPLIP